jgi:hypothetical protein
MKNKLFIYISILFLILTAFTGDIIGQSVEKFDRRIQYVKEKLNFSKWPVVSGNLRSGLAISSDILPQISKMRLVEPEDDFRIERLQKMQFIEINRKWKYEKNRFDAVMITATTSESARNHLILRYAYSQPDPPPVKRMGADFGLKIGDICLVTPEDSAGESFTSIDFVRDNVIIMLSAEGGIRKELRAMAKTIDAMLLKNKSALKYDDLPDIPRIKTFSVEKSKIHLGEKVPLSVEINNPGNNKLNFYWEVTGGGVEKNLLDQFIYYAGDPGKQKIQLTVINDVGLYHTQTLNVEVSEKQ